MCAVLLSSDQDGNDDGSTCLSNIAAVCGQFVTTINYYNDDEILSLPNPTYLSLLIMFLYREAGPSMLPAWLPGWC